MRRRLRNLRYAPALLLVCTGCDSRTPTDPSVAQEVVRASPGPSEATERQAATSDGTGTPAAPDDCAPVRELAALDHRRPVPLQPMMAWHQKQNMMDHLVAVQQITEGLAGEDWEAIESAAARIGSSPQMAQMCEHMGAGADGFTELALDFHRQADEIGVAARAASATGVLEATNRTLQRCTSCHSAYRQEVLDASTWRARTGSAHTPGAHLDH
ncbi:MAG: hypothetical protein AAF938_14620 [Myxococcota bacterium]